MSFISLVRFFSQAALTLDLATKVSPGQPTAVRGVPRLVKGLIGSALAQEMKVPLLVITSTLEEASRWGIELEAMGWETVQVYPTSEASPYESYGAESELIWGQFQVLADLSNARPGMAIVATERALQIHLPPVDVFQQMCPVLSPGISLKDLTRQLTLLGYERVNLVEVEGQWSLRGDILDVYPVASEWPVRLEWFGDDLEKIREFDPSTQRSQDPVSQIRLTPTTYGSLLYPALLTQIDRLPPNIQDTLLSDQPLEGSQRFLKIAYEHPVSLIQYLLPGTLIVLDEPNPCQAHADQWLAHAEEQWQTVKTDIPDPIHRSFQDCLTDLDPFPVLEISELGGSGLECKSYPIPAIPQQFGQLAKRIREQRQQGIQVWIISAQPSRAVTLLQEHDCPAQFIPNPKDFPAIDRQIETHTPIALKYSGLAELQGFLLPVYGLMVITDREFFGQHTLATPGYVRRRRRAVSRQVDPNLLQPGDYVVHKAHGIGKFLKLETRSLDGQSREYLVIEYSDGFLRVAADQVNSISRFRSTSDKPPVLNAMHSQSWKKTKDKVKKAIQKVAYDLLELYAKRAEQKGFSFPVDSVWQQELEESFPYQPTPDQLKSIQEVKQDMESSRPMDRLVCGDVGFGKTEVAVRAIFKAIVSGKQVAFLAPTTILTQQHYRTLKERYAPYPVKVGLLNRFRTTEEKKEILARMTEGDIDVVVGTHQLLGKEVRFKDLGLLVIDEEQRFGVNQKEKIKTLKTQVDVLTLSATPIPRTLYMSLSGVREMSLITTPPPSRRPIKTHLSPYNPEAVATAIRQELDRGGQIFYVVNRVEGIEEVCVKIQQMIPSARIGIAHGQMPEGELESTMLTFNNAEMDILVCTTIIESGLDIPRVNTILIENAESFGLSQLYQLRGRVGRSGIQAHAWLFYKEKGTLSEEARQRLKAIQEFTQLGSGYQLAMRDMEIRGVGNLLGTEQSGQMNSVGFDLYMEMLQDAIKEIRGQTIPEVDDAQIDLNVTAMIPQTYIPDPDQKMQAYRQVATSQSRVELYQIASEWSDRYGSLPKPVEELLRIMELKQLAKSVGFSRIKPEREHVILETPMAEPAWQKLKEGLPSHLQSRFVYQHHKKINQVTVRGLGQSPPTQQLENLIQWLDKLKVVRDQVSFSSSLTAP